MLTRLFSDNGTRGEALYTAPELRQQSADDRDEPYKDDLNPYPWYDINCGTCYSIIATVQIVPDDKRLEPSNN
jgi:hypothetical protein